MTLEHLLLALTQDLKTREILSACGANVERLRQRLERCLAERLEQLPEGVNAEPQQTIGIERVLQRAAIFRLLSRSSRMRSNKMFSLRVARACVPAWIGA